MTDFRVLEQLREKISGEILTYGILMDALSDYSSPRDVITRWLARKELIRIKKGLYVFGPRLSKSPVSLDVVANLIYGPSYVSCEFALSHYGMIPEAVYEITSVTTKRNKMYDTPLGRFSYRYLHVNRYHVGLDLVQHKDEIFSLYATKEKALCDMLFFQKIKVENSDELYDLLTQGYRIDEDRLAELSLPLLSSIALHYRSPTVNILLNLTGILKHAS